jgi:hypothetical protein
MRKLVLLSIMSTSFLPSVGFCSVSDSTNKVNDEQTSPVKDEQSSSDPIIKVYNIKDLTGTDVELSLESGIAFNGVMACSQGAEPILHFNILMDNTAVDAKKSTFQIISEKLKNSKDGATIDLSYLIAPIGLEILKDLFRTVSVNSDFKKNILRYSSMKSDLTEEFLKELDLDNLILPILNRACFLTVVINQNTGRISLSTNSHMLKQMELISSVWNVINDATARQKELNKELERKKIKVQDSIALSEKLKEELEILEPLVAKAKEEVDKNPAVARCDQLDKDIAQLEGEIAAMAPKIATLQSAIPPLQSDYNTKNTAATARRATTAQKNAANDAKARLTAKQNELTNEINTKTAQEKKLSEFKTEKASLAQPVESLRKNFEEQEQKLNKLRKDLADIEKSDNMIAYRVAEREIKEELESIKSGIKKQIEKILTQSTDLSAIPVT